MKRSLRARYALVFGGLISLTLLLNNLAEAYFSYSNSVQNLANIQTEMARVASAQVRQYLADLDQLLDVLSEDPQAGDPLQAQVRDIIRLRRVPAFSAVALIDRSGRERFRMSRTAADRINSREDYSALPEFQQAFKLGYFRSGAYFLNESEPHVNIAIASKAELGGIVIASVSLEVLLRGVTDTKIGTSGYAFAVDENANLVAHQDLNLVLKGTKVADLPQVVRARQKAVPGATDSHGDYFGQSLSGARVLTAHQSIPELNWLVFVEQPAFEALWPLMRAAALHTFLMLLIALALALLVTSVMVRRLVTPIRALQESVRQIANGSLSHRIELDSADELQDLADQFNRMAENLRVVQNEMLQSEKFVSLGGMVAGVAHELNTPIGNALLAVTTVMNVSEETSKAVAAGTMKRSRLDIQLQSITEGTQLAEVSLQRAASLISSFKQVAVDQSSERLRDFDLATVITEVVNTLRPGLNKQIIQLNLDVPEGIAMHSYPGPIGQVVMNLVNNAALHAFEGRQAGEVTVSARRVDGNLVTVEVRDNGVGIARENLGRVFDPFFTTKLGRGGSGLGLSISYRIATKMLGGQLQMQSTERVGTSVAMTIPIMAPA